MNHTKVITDVLAKYADFPTVQNDMRKLLGYAESQFRMFLTPIIRSTTDTEPTEDRLQQLKNGNIPLQ